MILFLFLGNIQVLLQELSWTPLTKTFVGWAENSWFKIIWSPDPSITKRISEVNAFGIDEMNNKRKKYKTLDIKYLLNKIFFFLLFLS